MIEISFTSGMLATIFAWIAFRVCACCRSKQLDPKYETRQLFFLINLLVIVRFTFYPFSKVDGQVQPLIFDAATAFPFRMNLVPFVNLLEYESRSDLLINIIGNFAMFIPTGIMLPMIYRKMNSLKRVVLTGFAISLAIEIIQLPFSVRASDVDDLILNTVGCLAGYGIYTLVRKIGKKAIASLLLTGLVLLTGCTGSEAPPAVITEPTTVPAIPETTVPAIPETTIPTTEAPTLPPHSQLYIPGVSVEDVILYFNEVCLDAEFVNSGDASLLQKWAAPIRYALHGEYTEQDIATLTDFTGWLNTIEGFPGIFEAGEDEMANLHIHFCSWSELEDLMGSQFSGMDGAVTFWYTDNMIYDAIICCRSDVHQSLRNSVILEELYNGLGPVQDTFLRADSIIYAEYSETQSLTEMDELILKLLYHPQLLCGMDAAECEVVIRQLYY